MEHGETACSWICSRASSIEREYLGREETTLIEDVQVVFRVDDVRDIYEELVAKGVTFDFPPREMSGEL